MHETIACAAVLTAMPASGAVAQDAAETEFKHDDDDFDIHFALISRNAGQQVSMHYSIGAEMRRVDAVRIFVSGGTIKNIKANIRIIQLDGNNAEIVVPFVPYAIGKWNEVPLVGDIVTVRGNVMVALEWVTPTGDTEPFSSFFIGADRAVANHDGYIRHPGGEWHPAGRFGSSGAKNFYIRLVTQKM